MRRAPHLSTKNRANASLLLRTPGPGHQRPLSNSSSFGAGASTYLRRTDRLTGSMLRLVTFSPLHLLYSTFVHFMLPPSLSLCLRPPPPFLALTLRGFTYTVRAQTVAQFTRTGPGLWTLKWGCVCNSAGRGCELLLLPQKTLGECGSETEGGLHLFSSSHTVEAVTARMACLPVVPHWIITPSTVAVLFILQSSLADSCSSHHF